MLQRKASFLFARFKVFYARPSAPPLMTLHVHTAPPRDVITNITQNLYCFLLPVWSLKIGRRELQFSVSGVFLPFSCFWEFLLPVLDCAVNCCVAARDGLALLTVERFFPYMWPYLKLVFEPRLPSEFTSWCILICCNFALHMSAVNRL